MADTKRRFNIKVRWYDTSGGGRKTKKTAMRGGVWVKPEVTKTIVGLSFPSSFCGTKKKESLIGSVLLVSFPLARNLIRKIKSFRIDVPFWTVYIHSSFAFPLHRTNRQFHHCHYRFSPPRLPHPVVLPPFFPPFFSVRVHGSRSGLTHRWIGRLRHRRGIAWRMLSMRFTTATHHSCRSRNCTVTRTTWSCTNTGLCCMMGSPKKSTNT